jgi:hypothetical protein
MQKISGREKKPHPAAKMHVLASRLDLYRQKREEAVSGNYTSLYQIEPNASGLWGQRQKVISPLSKAQTSEAIGRLAIKKELASEGTVRTMLQNAGMIHTVVPFHHTTIINVAQ